MPPELPLQRSTAGFSPLPQIILDLPLNCTINLLHDVNITSNSQFEEVALICRLVLWIFLTIAPFYHATKANETSETLSDSRLVMLKDSCYVHR